MTCTTHHNACDCREAHFATIALEREHWFSLANQRALDLAAERERVRGLEGALRLFTRCAYPVSTSINPRGYGWMPQKDLDYALSEARKALGEG